MPESSSRIAVLFAGMGSLATTTIACTLLARRGAPLELSPQLRRSGLGGRDEITRACRLAPLDDIVFGAWDVISDNAFTIAHFLEVVPLDLLDSVRQEMRLISPMRGIIDPENVPAPGVYIEHAKPGSSRAEWAVAIETDIRDFCARNHCARAVVIWTGTQEINTSLTPAHRTVEAFESNLQFNVVPAPCSQVYAWAAVRAGAAFLSGTPGNAIDFAAIRELARARAVPIAGQNFRVPPFDSVPQGATPPLPPAEPKIYEASGPSGATFSDSIEQSEANPVGPRPRRESRATAPAVLEAALFLELTLRIGRPAVQHWLNTYFSAPLASRGPESDEALFHETLRLLVAPAPSA